MSNFSNFNFFKTLIDIHIILTLYDALVAHWPCQQRIIIHAIDNTMGSHDP